MKKLFVVLAAALFAANVSAAQGDMVLSGGLGLNIDNVSPEEGDGVTTSAFEIAPSFTYFVSDKMGLGGKVWFDYEKGFDEDDNDLKATEFGVGVFARYYLMKTEKFGVFAQADFGVGFGNQTTTVISEVPVLDSNGFPTLDDNGDLVMRETSQDVEAKYTGISLGITPGIQYFINRKWSIELSMQNLLGLNVLSMKDAGTITNFGLSVNPNNVKENPFAVNFAPLQVTLNYHF